MTSLPLWTVHLGRIDYDAAVALQERVHRARLEQRIPDVLLLLEHEPVITLGRAAKRENILVDPAVLEARGVQVRETARGGDVTYHGPGQLVGYPIFNLNVHGRDVTRYVRGVEEALIRALERFSVTAGRVPRLTGVWVGDEKIAAIGVGVRKWVTWHGFALNLSTDLDAFSVIVPCGISDRGVTSLERVLGRPVELPEATDAIEAGFHETFGVHPERRSLEELEAKVKAS
ncbi:MAG: lipoyl(octanoyl) transferase LipB [Armatimonadota bacterium]